MKSKFTDGMSKALDSNEGHVVARYVVGNQKKFPTFSCDASKSACYVIKI